MPSESLAQARFMRAISHNADFAKKAGVPQKVGRDFERADKRAGKFQGKKKAKTIISAQERL